MTLTSVHDGSDSDQGVSYPLDEGEMVMICPYNNSHKPLASKFVMHLVKCRRIYPHSGLEVCGWDSSHHVPSSKLESHMDTCPSRPNSEAQTSDVSDMEHLSLNVSEGCESWDEAQDGTYYPSLKLKTTQNLIVPVPQGLTKAKRRNFRNQQYKRYQLHRSSESDDSHSPSPSRPSSAVQAPMDKKPLRLPAFPSLPGSKNVVAKAKLSGKRKKSKKTSVQDKED